MPDLSWATERPLQRALVVYDSRFGQTEQVAIVLAQGIRSQGVATDVAKAAEVDLEQISSYDLIAIGSPTERLTASPAIRRFLGQIKRLGLAGRYGFAFETRAPHHAGVAGRHIESSLVRLGFKVVERFTSATVIEPPGARRPRSPSSETQGHPLDPASEKAIEGAGIRLVQTIRGEGLEQWA